MEIIVRATVIFWAIWVITRGLGKRELAEMSPFELILLVTVGDLIQQGVTQEDFSLTGSLLAVGTIAAWVLLSSLASFRSHRVRRVLDGTPLVVVRNGRILEDHLRLERLTDDDVRQEARSHGIADMAMVEWGLLEPDGRFSFITRDDPAASDRPRPPEEHRAD